jgi:hypothetical protein
LCCLDQFFRKKRLLRTGTISAIEAVDPQIILWENLGVSPFYRACEYLKIGTVMLCIFIVNFLGMLYFQFLEKDLVGIQINAC